LSNHYWQQWESEANSRGEVTPVKQADNDNTTVSHGPAIKAIDSYLYGHIDSTCVVLIEYSGRLEKIDHT